MAKILHALTIKHFSIGDIVRTRCGKSANVDSVGIGAAHMIDASGNQFFGSTHAEAVTCKKCVNLLTVGTIHDKPRRTSDAQKRAVAHAR